jgi:glycosyltransferase involved in cell wall biosynthesis
VIKKQLDLGLMVRLVRARPKYSFVMVGPVMNVSGKEREVAELRQLSNVYWLGEKSADQLASYEQHFDVCVQCYEISDYTRYIYPLKLNEYLATGRPTISSPIDAVTGLGSVVSIAGSEAEWLAAIDQCLTAAFRTSAAAEARRAFARSNDWESLVNRIASLFPLGPIHVRQATTASSQSA